jgi:hypothetical protein
MCDYVASFVVYRYISFMIRVQCIFLSEVIFEILKSIKAKIKTKNNFWELLLKLTFFWDKIELEFITILSHRSRSSQFWSCVQEECIFRRLCSHIDTSTILSACMKIEGMSVDWMNKNSCLLPRLYVNSGQPGSLISLWKELTKTMLTAFLVFSIASPPTHFFVFRFLAHCLVKRLG